ncbi:hypothetical protein K1719_046701 [Acacia pycnantha]|nr:hypothetical protein K1719_046701 [Acacia pycnantha]
MLRKRTRSLQKDQHLMGHVPNSDANSDYYSQSQSLGRNIKNNSIFNVPRVLVGLDPKGLLDSDSVRSPTSPLDVRVLSNLGNPVRTPRSSTHEGNQRSWECGKVGLSIIDSLEDCPKFSGKILQPSESNNFSLSPRMRVKIPNCQAYTDSFEASKSLPKDFCKPPYHKSGSISGKGESKVLFEIGETLPEVEPFGKNNYENTIPQVGFPPHFNGGSQNSSALSHTEFNSKPSSICTSNDFVGSLSADEIELSEDYTCVICRGPNPKTTHIFGDCILETHSNGFGNHSKNQEGNHGVLPNVASSLRTPNQYPSSDFLSFCYHCDKKLEEGKDIYIYRGEKAFCNLSCRALEIMIDEELEKKSNPSSGNSSPKPENSEELLGTGIFTAT